MKRALLACCFFMSLTLGVRGQTSAEEVIALEKKRFTAMVNRDTAFLSQVLAPDLLYSHTTGAVDTKQSLIASIATGKLQYLSMDLKDVAYRLYNDVVILNGTMNIRVLPEGGKELDLKIKYLDVYRKQGQQWQLLAWQSAKLN